MKILTISIFICAFLLVRPYHMQQTGLMYIGDDWSYFAHATSIAYGEFPSYEKELYMWGDKRPKHSIGPGLIAAPFVFLFSIFDRINGSDIVIQRSEENVSDSWSLFGFVFSASLYFWFACYLLYRGLRYHFERSPALWTIIFVVLCQGVPLFIYRRPIYSHGSEFFLQAILVYILLKKDKVPELLIENRLILIAIGVVVGMIPLVRPNNILIALFWPIILLFDHLFIKSWKSLLSMFIISISLFILFIILPNSGENFWAHYYIRWAHKAFRQIIDWGSLGDLTIRFLYVLGGLDWGLLYTAPFVLIGVVWMIISQYSLKPRLVLCLVPLCCNFYFFILRWSNQAGWYGYRYILLSAIPVMVYPIAALMDFGCKRYGRKFIFLFGVIAFFPLMSMLCFEGNSDTLTLSTDYGGLSWGNYSYQIEVWKVILFSPIEFMIAILKGGPLYLIYVVANLFNLLGYLPPVITVKYPEFRIDILMKTLILYSTPFILYYLIAKKQDSRSGSKL